jgi:hypothetical protein
VYKRQKLGYIFNPKEPIENIAGGSANPYEKNHLFY